MQISIKQIFYEFIHKQPYGTEDIVKIEDIIIPFIYKQTQPKTYKVIKYTDLYLNLGFLDKPITVIAVTNEMGKPNKFILQDEYIRFLIAKHYGLDKVPVRYKKDKKN